MKIQEFKNLSVKELTEQLIEKGIKNTKLDKALGTIHLPSEGKFVDYEVRGEVVGDDDYRHIALITEKGESISLSRLQITAFKGDETEENVFEVGENAKNPGTFYLKGEETPNPHLTGNQATALKKLMFSNFKAEEVTLKRMKYVKGGYSSKDEVLDNIPHVQIKFNHQILFHLA
jgi:hypothetical protein